jgi:hypothetical protein
MTDSGDSSCSINSGAIGGASLLRFGRGMRCLPLVLVRPNCKRQKARDGSRAQGVPPGERTCGA